MRQVLVTVRARDAVTALLERAQVVESIMFPSRIAAALQTFGGFSPDCLGLR